jgi:hypothetical protein
MLSSLIEHIVKYKERAALTGMGLGLLVLIGAGLYLQKSNNSDKNKAPVKEVNKVELEVKKQTSNNSPAKNKSTFYLRPSAQELLGLLATMENLQEEVAQKKFENLRVLWPVYFFSMEPSAAESRLLLDISEDGFGAVVTGTVKSEEYPELQSKQPGDSLWVAGEIVGVDPSGTGTIHLDISLLDFSVKGPIPQQEEMSGDSNTKQEASK